MAARPSRRPRPATAAAAATADALRALQRVRGLSTRTIVLIVVAAIVVVAGAYAVSLKLGESTGPGTLVEVDHLSDADALSGHAAHVVYRSTDGRSDRSITVSGTMFVPAGTAPAGGWPVLAFGRDVGSLDQACAAPTSAAVRQSSEVIQFLSRGYAVAFTDYSTPDGAGPQSYLDNATAGVNVIDSVRALRRTFPNVSSRWAALGVLQGGGAVWEADARAARYAPELQLVGAVALSPTADMSGLVGKAQQGTLTPDQAGILTWTLNSLGTSHPDLDLSAYRTDLAAQDGAAPSDCSTPTAPGDSSAASTSTSNSHSVDFESTTRGTEELRTLLAGDATSARTLSAPLSVVFGSADTVVDPQWTTSAIRRTCATGSTVTWQRTPETGRTDDDRMRQIDWITDRFRGVPAENTCATTSDPSAGAGSVVSRLGTPAAASLLPPGTRSAGVVYRSTEGDTGEATVVSGTVFSPSGPPPTGGWPVIALGHGTTGIDIDCAPSRSSTLLNQVGIVATFLSLGYAVTLTDYQGLGTAGVHPYLDARTAGLNVIDSVRALRATLPDISSRWAAVGQSQGGAATWAADEQAGTYAPELTLVGAVAIAPAASVTQIIGKVENGTLTRDQIPAVALILTSLNRLHPDVDLDDFRRGVAARFWDSLSACSGSAVTQGNIALSQITPADLAPTSTAAADRVTGLLSRWALPQRPSTAPLSVAYGSADELVDAGWTTSALARACAAGDTVMIGLQPGRGHSDVDLSAQLPWLRDRFAGSPAPDNCP